MSSGLNRLDQQALKHYVENAVIPLQVLQVDKLLHGPAEGRDVLANAFWQELDPQQDRLAIVSIAQVAGVLQRLIAGGSVQAAETVLDAIYDGSLPQIQLSSPSSADAYNTLVPPKDAGAEYAGRIALSTWLGMTVLRSMMGDFTQAAPGADCSPSLETAVTGDPLWDGQRQAPNQGTLLRGFQLLDTPWKYAQVSLHGLVAP